MQQLVETARAHSLRLMEGEVLANNHEMLNLATKLGFAVSTSEEDSSIRHIILQL